MRRTYFLHEADGKPLLSQETLRDLRPDWTWDGEKWNIPVVEDTFWANKTNNELTAETDPTAISNSEA